MYGRYAHFNDDKVPLVHRILTSQDELLFQCDFEDIVLTYIECALWFRSFNEQVRAIVEPDK